MDYNSEKCVDANGEFFEGLSLYIFRSHYIVGVKWADSQNFLYTPPTYSIIVDLLGLVKICCLGCFLFLEADWTVNYIYYEWIKLFPRSWQKTMLFFLMTDVCKKACLKALMTFCVSLVQFTYLVLCGFFSIFCSLLGAIIHFCHVPCYIICISYDENNLCCLTALSETFTVKLPLSMQKWSIVNLNNLAILWKYFFTICNSIGSAKEICNL